MGAPEMGSQFFEGSGSQYASELLVPPRFLIVGLTGPYGSGCTTVARLLHDTQCDGLARSLSGQAALLDERIAECQRMIGSPEERSEASGTPIRAPRLPVLDPSVPVAEYDASAAARRPDGLRGHYHSLLVRLLNQRAWVRALLNAAKLRAEGSDSARGEFKHISLSDVLLMLTIEDATAEARAADLSEPSSDCSGLADDFVARIVEFKQENQELRRDVATARSMAAWGDKDVARSLGDDGARLREYVRKVQSLKAAMGEASPDACIEFFQDRGDHLRTYGRAFAPRGVAPEPLRYGGRIAEEANLLVRYWWRTTGIGWFCIECFRNRAEVEHFRRRLANFFLIALHASPEDRRDRVGGRSAQWEPMERRDRGSGGGPGSVNVPECVDVADIAIDNDGPPDPDAAQWQPGLLRKLHRALSLMMEPGCCPPTPDEENMHLAHSASLRSMCISRQVGAVVTSRMGHVLAVGWNDAPMGQVSCGHLSRRDYSDADSPLGSSFLGRWRAVAVELRALKFAIEGPGISGLDGDVVCFKDLASAIETAAAFAKSEDLKSLFTALRGLAGEASDSSPELGGAIRQILADADVGVIASQMRIHRLEYCRALHAEENALLQVARIGGISVQGGTIYTTASPCELCTKKIYQVGIDRIVYTAPYPSKFAEAFRTDGVRRIAFDQFEGVLSPGYYRLFKPDYPAKDAQQLRAEAAGAGSAGRVPSGAAGGTNQPSPGALDKPKP